MLLALATKRLKRMAHVGLTERLDESVVSMAADLGLNFSGPAYRYTSASAFSYDGGEVDQDELITYNATTQGGVNVTLARSEATKRLQEILAEEKVLREEIDLLVPRLNRLVDKEAEWLAEQEELKQAAQAEETGEADPQQQLEGEAAEHGGAGSPEAAAEPAESVERTQARAAAGRPGAEPAGAVAGAAAGEEGGATDATDGITEADVVAGDGSEQQQQEEGQAGSDGQDSSPPYDDGTPDHDAGTAAGEADPEGQDKEPIVSPWSKEIEELDGVVADKQEHMRQLEAEMASLQHSTLIVSADAATGRARQILPDDHFLMTGDTLGQAYRRCADAGRGRNEKRKPYKHLRTPWGESFRFSPEARQRIPHEVLARIHQLNPLDEELWKAGNDILERKLEEQREKGVLQAVPRGRYPPPAHSGYASKRRLNSNQEFVTNKYDWQASSFGKPAGGGDVLYSHLAPPPAKDHAAAAQPAGNEAGGHGVPVAAGGSGTQEWAATGQAAEQPAGADQATVENSEQQAADEQQAAEQQAAAEPSAPARVSSQGFAEQAAEQRAVPREVASLAGEQHGGLGAAAGAAALASAPSREEL